MSKTVSVDHPWRDERLLYEEYVVKLKTSREIASQWGCDKSTILDWVDRFDIDKQTYADRQISSCASLKIDQYGYERWTDYTDGTTTSVAVHQLLLIAEGEDPENVFSDGDYQTHHKNGIEWDNRPMNITLLSDAQHRVVHTGGESA